MKTWIMAATMLAAAGATSGAQAADAYPSRPIRLIVGYAPGGPVDTAARIYADYLGRTLHQAIVVDNRAGASGAIAADMTAKSPPDGYTLYFVASPTMTMTPVVQKSVNFNPTKDFTYIGLITDYTNVLVVNKDFPAKNVGELVSYARKHPDDVSFGSAGIGASNHLSAELLAQMSGVKMLHVPYKGNAQSIIDVIGGQVMMMFDQVSTSINYIRAGKLRALAVTSLTRSPLLPQVPTVDESGARGYEDITFNGLMAPAGTPRDILRRLNEEVAKAVRVPQLHQRFIEQGVELAASPSPEDFAAYVKAEFEKKAKLAREAGIRME